MAGTSAIISEICNALSLSDMRKYVCNAMRCHIACCGDFMECDCETDELEIHDHTPYNLCGLLCVEYEDDSESVISHVLCGSSE